MASNLASPCGPPASARDHHSTTQRPKAGPGEIRQGDPGRVVPSGIHCIPLGCRFQAVGTFKLYDNTTTSTLDPSKYPLPQAPAHTHQLASKVEATLPAGARLHVPSVYRTRATHLNNGFLPASPWPFVCFRSFCFLVCNASSFMSPPLFVIHVYGNCLIYMSSGAMNTT